MEETFSVRMPDGTILRNIPAGTTKEQIAAKYQQNTGQPAEPDTRGLLARSYDTAVQGVSDAMSTVAGDSFGLGGDPTANREEGVVGKAASVLGSDLIPAIGEIGSDALITGGKAVLDTDQEQWVADKVSDVANSSPVKAGMEAWGKFEDSNPDLARRVGQGANIAGVAIPGPRLKMPKPRLGKAYARKRGMVDAKDRRTQVGRMLEPDNLEGDGKVTLEGMMRTKTYHPTKWEADMIDEVTAVRGVAPTRSYTHNVNAVEDAVEQMRRSLDDSLTGVVIDPVTVEKKLIAAINNVGKNPMLAGEAGESAVRIFHVYQDLLRKATRDAGGQLDAAGLLQTRRLLDQTLEKMGGSSMFDPKVINARNTATKAIRDALNETVEQAAPDAKVLHSLQKQSRLLSARDRMVPRRATEKNNSLSRLVQNLERSTGISHPTTPLAVGATATHPVTAAAMATLAVGYGLTRPMTRAAKETYQQLLNSVDAAIKYGGPAAEALAVDRATLLELVRMPVEEEEGP